MGDRPDDVWIQSGAASAVNKFRSRSPCPKWQNGNNSSLYFTIKSHKKQERTAFPKNFPDFGDYEHARAMTKITSDYLSYIFRNTTDRVPVLAESKHCEDYLKILLLRYPDKFTYYIEVHDEVADAEIFPLIPQSFG